jgi:hypothetical protein
LGNRLTLTTAARILIDERDAANSHFTDLELYGFANQAIRYLGADMEWPFQTAQTTSVVDQAVYTLPEDFIALADFFFDNEDIPIIERADLSAFDKNWQIATSGRPRYAYKSDNAKIGLWPKPSTENAGKVIQIQYIKLPADLSTDGQVPDLHTAFQDCIPFYVAFLCEHAMGNSKRAELNLGLYDSHKKTLRSKLQRFSDDTLAFRWSGRY